MIAKVRVHSTGTRSIPISLAVRLAVEAELRGLVAVDAVRAHVLLADGVALGDHVHHRHRVASPEAVVVLQPLHDLAGLDPRSVEALATRLFEKLARGLRSE